MSTENLRTQLKEDYLTCAICCNNYIKPKALPCIHTFCESCLRDYVASRGYESAVSFPCPICREECPMPTHGVVGFPNNHLMSSLSDTVYNEIKMSKPVPKPRRSLECSGNINQVQGVGGVTPQAEGTDANDQPVYFNSHQPKIPVQEMTFSPGPDGFDVIDEADDPKAGTSVDSSPPPPYSSVVDSKLCSNDHDPRWMFVPKPDPSGMHQSHYRGYTPPTLPSHTSSVMPVKGEQNSQLPIGWNVQHLSSPSSVEMQPDVKGHGQVTSNFPSNAALYPSVPLQPFENRACTENLLLQFGKQGSTSRDFIKPQGLAVSKDGNFIVSDSGGDQNRIMIFNSGGEITTAFKCGAKVKDIAVTQKNEIIASIDKNTSALRLFTICGQLKGEFGKFFTFEEPCGIAELKNQGVVLTGVEGRCVYVLTDQMKLCTKFGRKGNGDGYFMHPGFVTVDSKNQIIVTDKMNSCIQVFNCEGKFKQRFGMSKAGQLNEPMGVCVDSLDNIVVANSGSFSVEVFSPSGQWLCSVVKDTFQLGENVRPVNVAMTQTGKIAVLLCGPYFAQVRVYNSRHPQIPQEQQPSWNLSSVWYSK